MINGIQPIGIVGMRRTAETTRAIENKNYLMTINEQTF
jgi:hypothetical protein